MRHFYQTIPGWFSFRGLYEQAVKEAPNPAHFVEVGCWKGRSSAFMAVEIINSGKKVRLDCVDTWLGSKEPKHLADPSVKNGTLYREFIQNIAPVLDRIKVYRQPSVECAATHPDNSIDFLLLDGAHDEENVLNDLNSWWPKIKPGGVMAGDDYLFKGVNKAVLEFFAMRRKLVESVKGSGNGCAWRVRK